MTPPLWQTVKKPLDESERREWKSWLKAQHSENEDHGIRSYHFMGNRWETVGTVSDLIFLDSKISADGDCSHEIKRRLLLRRKVMTNLDSIFKSRDITLPTKVHLVKAMVFPVVMYRCESWTVKKAEHWRIDAFELRCWRRLLRVPWTTKSSNQSILKEISPGISLEGMMLKLKLQYFGHLMQSWLIGKDFDAGRDWGKDVKGTTEDEMARWHHWLDGRECEWTPGVGDGQGGLACCDSWGRRVGHDWATELNWMMPLTYNKHYYI